jgi:hypothetical protein
MPEDVIHLALIWSVSNKLLIIPQHVSLSLLHGHWAPGMVAVVHHSFIIAAEAWFHIPADVLFIGGSFNDKL